jgi:hypothetical protein
MFIKTIIITDVSHDKVMDKIVPAIQSSHIPPIVAMAITGLMVIFLLNGCSSTNTIHATTQVQNIDLESQALKASGIAFLTPTSITGQEEDRQALALTYTETLELSRPGLRIVPLAETLGKINSSGLTGEYRRMYEDSRLTGILNRDTLQKVARTTDARYLAQLKLSGFKQGSENRWGFLGLRIVDTQLTSLRMYLQIWDSETGMIVWEGSQELTASIDTMKNDPITFKVAVEESAKELISRLP